MPRIALWNIFFGFLVICLGAAAGALVAADLTRSFVDNLDTATSISRSWELTIQSSAHGHTNLFGIIHIVTGLTMPYARLGSRAKIAVTLGLTFGVFAMGPLMIWRSTIQPTMNYDLSGILIGACLVGALTAMAIQTAGLWLAFRKRL